MELKFVEVDGVVIEVRDYGTEQLCRVNQNRDPKLYRTWVATRDGLSYDDVIAYLVRRETEPKPAESTHRVRITF